MEPLRKCRTATFFKPCAGAKWAPCDLPDPDSSPCPQCAAIPKGGQCSACGCWRTTLMALDPQALAVPPCSMDDFRRILTTKGARASVAVRELERYATWTKEFGSEGA